MKTTTKFALLAAMLAAGNSAWAQTTQTVPAGVPYVFSSGTLAAGTGTISYQWYRNNEPIDGATANSYTLPGDLAHGTEVGFRRGAVSSNCPYTTIYSNVFVITFLEPLVIGGIRWAQFNVAASGVFATQPDMYTQFYQWNKTTAYSATDPLSPTWNATANTSSTWTVNPCPTGWRLPTQAEFQALHDAGTTWVDANARGNAVAGRFYGPNSANCTLPSNMTGCIFLPAAGFRANSDGTLNSQGNLGHYWSSTQYSSALGYILYITDSGSNPLNYLNKAYSFSVRCVQ